MLLKRTLVAFAANLCEFTSSGCSRRIRSASTSRCCRGCLRRRQGAGRPGESLGTVCRGPGSSWRSCQVFKCKRPSKEVKQSSLPKCKTRLNSTPVRSNPLALARTRASLRGLGSRGRHVGVERSGASASASGIRFAVCGGLALRHVGREVIHVGVLDLRGGARGRSHGRSGRGGRGFASGGPRTALSGGLALGEVRRKVVHVFVLDLGGGAHEEGGLALLAQRRGEAGQGDSVAKTVE